MIEEKSSALIRAELNPTTSAKRKLLDSLKDRKYRAAFVCERVRSSVALQIRALREQRNKMTQTQLGDLLGMAQTWVSKLENPEYGKMTVATLLRLAEAFDADLEIKFRSFSRTIDALATQGPEYFHTPSFDEELPEIEQNLALEEAARANLGREAAIVGTYAVTSGRSPIESWFRGIACTTWQEAPTAVDTPHFAVVTTAGMTLPSNQIPAPKPKEGIFYASTAHRS